jgi:hypothetical protein
MCQAFTLLQTAINRAELVAIVQDLKGEHEDYKQAIQGLNDAIAFIGEATRRTGKVAETIQMVATAASLAETAIKTAAA